MITPIISLVILIILQNVGFALFVWKVFYPLYKASVMKNDPILAGGMFKTQKEPTPEERKETQKNELIRAYDSIISKGTVSDDDIKRFSVEGDTTT